LTIPSMLFSIAGLYCWLAVLLFNSRRDFKTIFNKFIIPCILFTVGFSLVFYTPTLAVTLIKMHSIEPIINNRFVAPQEWTEFLVQLSPHITSTLDSIFRDIPWFLLLFFTLLVLIGIFRYIKNRDYPSLLLLPSILFGSAIILLLQHTIPFDRTWIYIIPFIILVADAGFTSIIEHLSPKMKLYILLPTFLAAVIFARYLVSSNVIAMYPDTGTFSEAPIAAKFLKTKTTELNHTFAIQSQVPADYPLYFYLWYYDVPYKIADNGSSPENIIYIVEKSSYSIQDMTDKPVIKLLDIGDMEIYQGVKTK
jgi:hypothetical protein